eukprot:9182893-Pyramimonas_sp.AAC.1
MVEPFTIVASPWFKSFDVGRFRDGRALWAGTTRLSGVPKWAWWGTRTTRTAAAAGGAPRQGTKRARGVPNSSWGPHARAPSGAAGGAPRGGARSA